MTRKILSLAAATVLLLAACRNGGNDTPAVPTVIDKVASETASNTTDLALPIDINTLQLSDAGTDETSLPQAVN